MLIAAACGGSSNKNNAASGSSGGSAGGTASDSTKPTVGGSLVYAQGAEDAGGLCLPEAQLDIDGIAYAQTIYDTLTSPNEKGEFVPDLAKSVEHNADATVWTITLPDGVKFHDGTALTATVVKNNLDAYRGKYPARHPILFGLVFGPYVSDVTADDTAKTVTVTTAQPWPAFAAYLWSEHRLGIMAQKQLDDGADCAKDLIGTGPFMLKEWVINDHFTAVKNPDYWKKDKDGTQLPYLDQITIKPVPDGQQRLNGLQSGQFQAISTGSALDVEQIRALAKQGTVTNTESDKFTGTEQIMLNETKPPFDNAHARKAVALAFDTETFRQVRLHNVNQVANGPYSPGAEGFLDDSGYPKFNLEAAKAEVAAFKTDTGQDLSFTLGNIPDPTSVEDLNFTKTMLEAAGMKVSTYTVEQTQYINKAVARDFEAYYWDNFPGTGGDTLFVWWHCNTPANPCDNLVNFGGFNDAQINSDLDKGRVELDATKQKAFYEDVNKTFASQIYNVWIAWTTWSVATSPKVHGVFGPDLPNGDKPSPALSDSHAMSGLFITP